MKRIISIFSLISSIISFILSMVLFNMETGSYETPLFYGGDAYTGIQQAAAQSANNTMALAEICRLGFGAICLTASFAFFILAFLLFTANIQEDSRTDDTSPVNTSPINTSPVNTSPAYTTQVQPVGSPDNYPSAPFVPNEAVNNVPPQSNVPPAYNVPAEGNAVNTYDPYGFNNR